MRKLKVYLDTSVISHLLQEDVPEKMADTRQLWKIRCVFVYSYVEGNTKVFRAEKNTTYRLPE